MRYLWHDFNRKPTTKWNTHFYGTRVTDQHWPKVQQMLRKSCENIVLIASRLQIEYGGNKGRNIVCSYDVFVYRDTLSILYIYRKYCILWLNKLQSHNTLQVYENWTTQLDWMHIDLCRWSFYRFTIVVDLQILSLMEDVLPKSRMVVVITLAHRALICIGANTDVNVNVVFFVFFSLVSWCLRTFDVLCFENWKSSC